jgi:hypothetical protein
MVFQMMDAHHVFRAMNEVSKPVLAVVTAWPGMRAGGVLRPGDRHGKRSLRAARNWGFFPQGRWFTRVIGLSAPWNCSCRRACQRPASAHGLVNRVVPRSNCNRQRTRSSSASPIRWAGPGAHETRGVRGHLRPFDDALRRSQDTPESAFRTRRFPGRLACASRKRKPVWKNKSAAIDRGLATQVTTFTAEMIN